MELAVNTKDLWKRALNDYGDVLIEGLILVDCNMYVVNPEYFPDNMEELFWSSRQSEICRRLQSLVWRMWLRNRRRSQTAGPIGNGSIACTAGRFVQIQIRSD